MYYGDFSVASICQLNDSGSLLLASLRDKDKIVILDRIGKKSIKQIQNPSKNKDIIAL
jgi:hypothetical protein